MGCENAKKNSRRGGGPVRVDMDEGIEVFCENTKKLGGGGGGRVDMNEELKLL